MHAWDLATAAGNAAGNVTVVPADLATDGIHEVVDVLLPRQVRLGRLTGALPVVALQAPGNGPSWRLDLDPGAGPGGRAVALVRGDAVSLLLLLWRRIGIDDPRLLITGDAAAARRTFEACLTP